MLGRNKRAIPAEGAINHYYVAVFNRINNPHITRRFFLQMDTRSLGKLRLYFPIPILVILDGGDFTGTLRPEESGIARAPLEHSLAAEIELLQEFYGRIGEPWDRVASGVYRLRAECTASLT